MIVLPRRTHAATLARLRADLCARYQSSASHISNANTQVFTGCRLSSLRRFFVVTPKKFWLIRERTSRRSICDSWISGIWQHFTVPADTFSKARSKRGSVSTGLHSRLAGHQRIGHAGLAARHGVPRSVLRRVHAHHHLQYPGPLTKEDHSRPRMSRRRLHMKRPASPTRPTLARAGVLHLDDIRYDQTQNSGIFHR